MGVLALFLIVVATDYETPEIINRIDDGGKVVLAITAFIGLCVIIGRFAVWLDKRKDDRFAQSVKKIIDEHVETVLTPIIQQIVTEATSNIATNSNGGYSLSDVHERMDKIERKLSIPVKPRHPPYPPGEEPSDLD